MQLERINLGKERPETEFEKSLEKSFIRLIDQLVQILNNGFGFKDNFNAYQTTLTTSATPGVETAISHGLKKIPTGFLVLEKDKAANIYLGASGKNSTTYYIASDIASVTATLMVF